MVKAWLNWFPIDFWGFLRPSGAGLFEFEKSWSGQNFGHFYDIFPISKLCIIFCLFKVNHLNWLFWTFWPRDIKIGPKMAKQWPFENFGFVVLILKLPTFDIFSIITSRTFFVRTRLVAPSLVQFWKTLLCLVVLA